MKIATRTFTAFLLAAGIVTSAQGESIKLNDVDTGRVRDNGNPYPDGKGDINQDQALGAGVLDDNQYHPIFIFQMTGVAAPSKIIDADFRITQKGPAGTVDFDIAAYVIRTASSKEVRESDYESSATLLMNDFDGGSPGGEGRKALNAEGKKALASYLKKNWVENDYVFITLRTVPLTVTGKSGLNWLAYGNDYKGWTEDSTDAQLSLIVGP